MLNSLNAGRYTTKWDKNANLTLVSYDEQSFVPPVNCTYFKLNDNGIELEEDVFDNKHLMYKPVPVLDEREALIRSREKFMRFPENLRLSISERDGEIALIGGVMDDKGEITEIPLDKTPKIKNPPVPPGKVKHTMVSLTIAVPVSAVLHLAEYGNIGRRLDSDMALEHSYGGSLSYNMMLIEMDGFCIRFRTDNEDLNTTWVNIRRHEETFSVTFYWQTGYPALMGFFESYDEAMDDFKRWLKDKKNMHMLKDKKDTPPWIKDIKIVMFIDLMLSNWRTLHDFNDVINMAEDIKEHTDPKNVMFYIYGWAGAYDGCQPAYIPDKELGGEAGFKEMSDRLHEWGFKIMIHTCTWGVDPFVEDVEYWEENSYKLNGKISGWQLSKEDSGTAVSFDFRTAKIPLKQYAGMKKFTVPLGYLPGDCFTYLTIGDVSGSKGKIRLYHDRRPIITPTDWFVENNLYDYIYPLYYKCGMAEVEVEISDDADLDLENAWIQVRDSLTYIDPYATWTYPMLRGYGYCEGYVKTAAENISAVVKKYKIDGVHMDAASFYPMGDKETIMAVKNALPEQTLMGCEFYKTWEEIDFWTLTQSTCQDLVLSNFPKICIREQSSFHMLEGVHEYFSWMDKTSPICDFIKDYVYFYPHLVAANAFVPTNKISNITPERKLPQCDSEHWRILRNSKRLNFIPGLRLNYKKYGLDNSAIKAIEELT